MNGVLVFSVDFRRFLFDSVVLRWCLVFEVSLNKNAGFQLLWHGRRISIAKFHFAAVRQRVLVQNFSYENEFDFHENELTDETQFHKNCFAWKLILTQKQRATWKWLIGLASFVLPSQLVKWLHFNQKHNHQGCYPLNKKITQTCDVISDVITSALFFTQM